MAIICLKVPSNIAQTLEGIDVPGKHVPDGEKHITLHSLGSVGVAMPLDAIGKTISVIALATEKFKPFHVEATGYSSPFGRHTFGVPIVCSIKSPELQKLHETITVALDDAGISYTNYPEFRPHLTLSWSEEFVVEKVFKTPLAWRVESIALWCGAFGDERIYTVFELMG